jgi:replication-associated recombination protein RarA
MTEEEKIKKLSLLGQVFSPTSPIIARDLFFGRYEQIEKIVDSINENGQHIILFGERGVGKTSLANIINDQVTGVIPAKITCNRDDDFNNSFFSKECG